MSGFIRYVASIILGIGAATVYWSALEDPNLQQQSFGLAIIVAVIVLVEIRPATPEGKQP